MDYIISQANSRRCDAVVKGGYQCSNPRQNPCVINPNPAYCRTHEKQAKRQGQPTERDAILRQEIVAAVGA